MLEDKLSAEQRIRLEAISQANYTASLRPDVNITATANKYAQYIRYGTINEEGNTNG